MAFIISCSVLLSLTILAFIVIKFSLTKTNTSQNLSNLMDTNSLDVIKKYPSAKINSRRNLYFFSGLLIALIFSVVLIEYKTEIIQQNIFEEKIVYSEIDPIFIPPTSLNTPPPPPLKTIIDIIEVPDETIIKEPILTTPIDELVEISNNTNLEPIDIPIEEPEPTNDILSLIGLQQSPEYPGGMQKLMGDIARNFNGRLLEHGDKGKIYVEFVVERDGSISNVKILRGLTKRLDKEAKRVIQSLAKWSPGMNEGMPVRVRYAVPIKIQ